MAGSGYTPEQEQAFRDAVIGNAMSDGAPKFVEGTGKLSDTFGDRLASSAQRIQSHPTVQLAERAALTNLLGPVGGAAMDLGANAPAPAAQGIGRVSATSGMPGVIDGGEISNTVRQPTEFTRDVAPRPPPIASGPGIPNSLYGNVNNANAAQLKGLTDAGDLQRELGVDKAGRTMAVADLSEQNAVRMQRDAEIQQQADQKAAQQHQAFLDRQQVLADEIGEQRIDPSRLLHNADLKTQFTIGLGAALGGSLAAINGGPNSSLQHLDKMIDRDIESQVDAINNKKASLNARSSLFAQMLEETGDRRMAATATRNLIYQAMDQKMKADADRLGIPELRTNAEIMGQELDRRRNDLTADLAKQSLARAQAAAAAAASAQRAEHERMWQHQLDLEKLNQEQQKIDIERGKGNPADKERGKAQMELDANLAVLDRTEKDPSDVSRGTPFGNYAQSLPGIIPGVSEARTNAAARDAFNTQVSMMVAGAYKLSTNANEPKNLLLIEKYSKPFLVQSDDSDEVIKGRVQKLRKLMIEGGAVQGATGPAPATLGPKVGQ